MPILNKYTVAAPLVSIVIPCYNVAAYVGEALRAAFAQTWTDFEVLVVNDASPDTPELEAAIAPWRERIHYLRHERNGGVAAARNTALRAARGEWIAALDPDDSWEPGYLETQLRLAAAHPEADLIYGDAIIFGDVPEAGQCISSFSPSRGEATFEALVEEECTVVHCASIARRSRMVEAGGFDESLRTGEDFDLWLRLAAGGARILHHRAALARYRRRAGSLISDAGRAARNYLRILEKAEAEYARTPSQHAAIARQRRKMEPRLAVSEGKQALEQGDTTAALESFERARQQSPSRKLSLLTTGLRMAPWLVRAAIGLRALMIPSYGGQSGNDSLASRGLWMLTAKIIGFGLSMALPMLLARRLEKAEFGLYRQVFLIINTAITLLPFSMSMSAYYFLPREKERKGAVAAHILLFLLAASGMAAAILLAVPSLAESLTREPRVTAYLPEVGALIVLWTAGSMMESMMLANEEARLASVATGFVQLARTAFLVTAALVLPSVGAVLAAAILQGVLQCAVVAAYLLHRFPGFWRRFDRALLWRQLSYSIPLGAAGLLYTLQTDLHNYFVSSRFGPVEFAVYSVGCFQIPLMNLLGEATASVLIPQMMLLQQRGDHGEMIRLTLRAMNKMAVAGFPLFALLLVVAPELITMLYTDQYRDSVPVFRINLLLIPLSVLLTDPILRAFAEYRYPLLGLRVVLFGLQFALLWHMTGSMGAWSAIVVVVIITALERIASATLCARATGFTAARAGEELRPLPRIALASVVAAAAAAGLRTLLVGMPKLLILSVSGTGFGIVYLLLLLRTGQLDWVQSLPWIPSRWREKLRPA